MAEKLILKVSESGIDNANFLAIREIPNNITDSGDTIVVYPGTYVDPNTSNVTNVSIVGVGQKENVIFNGYTIPDGMTGQITFENISIHGPGLVIGNSAITIKLIDCIVSGNTGGIAITKGVPGSSFATVANSTLVIENSVILDDAEVGILAHDYGTTDLYQTKVYSNTSIISNNSCNVDFSILNAGNTYFYTSDESLVTPAITLKNSVTSSDNAGKNSATVTVNYTVMSNASDFSTFGATGDGSTDNNNAWDNVIQNMSSGGVLYIPDGIYLHSEPKILPSNLSIVSSTNAAIFFTGSSGEAALTWGNTTARANVAVTANLFVGNTIVSVASGAESPFAINDLVKIRSSEKYALARTPTIEIGELGIVKSTSDGQIELYNSLLDEYNLSNGTVSIELLHKAEKVIVSGLRFKANGFNNGLTAMSFYGAVNPTIDNCDFEGFDGRGLYFSDCVTPKTIHCNFSNAGSSSQGYGISWSNATKGGQAFHNYFRDVRHALSTNNEQAFPGVVRHCKGYHNYVEYSALATGGSTGDALDTHAVSEYIDYSYNTIINPSGSGINNEGNYFIARNNHVINAGVYGIVSHNYTDIPATFVIEDNIIDYPTIDGIRIGGEIGNSQIIAKSVVSDNYINSPGGIGIYARSIDANTFNGSLTIKNNHIDNAASATASILINHWNTLKVYDNEVISPTGHALRISNVNIVTGTGGYTEFASATSTRAIFLEANIANVSIVGGSGLGNSAIGIYIEDAIGPVKISGFDGSSFSTPLVRGSGLGHDIQVFGEDKYLNATISGGVVSGLNRNMNHIIVDTEAAGATDDLDTITATDIDIGHFVVVKGANSARDVTLTDAGTSGGNMRLAGSASFTFDDSTDSIALVWTGTSWLEVSRSNN